VSILGAFTVPRASLENPQIPISSASILDWFGIKPTAAGINVTEESSLGMAAVWSAVNLIAGTCASLPLKAYTRGDQSRKPRETGLAATLLDNPHPDLVPYDFWEIVHAHRLLWGNAYLLKLRNQGGQLTELWPIHPSRVKAGRVTSATGITTQDVGRKIYAIDGGEDAGGMTLYDDKILHLPAFGYDGICGVSPIRIARQGIGLGLAAEQYGAQLFGSGSLASGILQTDQRMKPEQANALHRRWKEKASGLGNAHEIIILDSGAKFQQLTIPPEDAQFIESRRFQIAEVARIFGVPLHLLQEVEGSTSWGTGIAEQTLGFVIFTLRRWLIRTEQSVTRILKPEPVYAKYSLEGLLRGAPKDRAEFYTKMWQLGVFSTNDIRELEDLGPVTGGDTRYVALNFGILGEQKPPPPAPQLPAAPEPASDPVPEPAPEQETVDAPA
jgi:HK97 family phage portal protein